jgi:hypothetical protein
MINELYTYSIAVVYRTIIMYTQIRQCAYDVYKAMTMYTYYLVVYMFVYTTIMMYT